MGSSMSVPQIYATRCGGLRRLEETVQLCFEDDELQGESKAEVGESISIILATDDADDALVRRDSLSRPLYPDPIKPKGPVLSRTDSEGPGRHIRDFNSGVMSGVEAEGRYGGSAGPKVDQWDELCIGFWRCTSAERLAGISGECLGVSILRTTTDEELQRMKPAKATGVRIIVLTNADARTGATATSDGNPLYPTAPASGTPSARTTLRQWFRERTQSLERFVQSVKQDERARERIKDSAVEQFDRQVVISKRLLEKLTSMEVIWRAAAFTHRTLERKLGEARSWWQDYSSRHK